MSKTSENLQAAFAGESQARNKYTTERDIKNCWKWSRPRRSKNANKQSSGNAAYAVMYTKGPNLRRNALRVKSRKNITNRLAWTSKKSPCLSIQ